MDASAFPSSIAIASGWFVHAFAKQLRSSLARLTGSSGPPFTGSAAAFDPGASVAREPVLSRPAQVGQLLLIV